MEVFAIKIKFFVPNTCYLWWKFFDTNIWKKIKEFKILIIKDYLWWKYYIINKGVLMIKIKFLS